MESVPADLRGRVPRRAWWWAGGAGVVALLAGLVGYIALEGDLAEQFVHLRKGLIAVVRHFGAPGSLGLLYMEESGIPLPMPGDVYIAYLGHLSAGSPVRLLGAWLATVAIVTAGSTNLYLISRRWGSRLLAHPLAAPLHLAPHRLEKAERWFARWGMLAMIFGRHIPGFRVPLTVVAATVRFPYRLFALAVAISTAIWSGVVLLLVLYYGPAVAHFVGRHSWVYAVGTVIVLGIAGYIVYGWSRATTSRRAD
jgi:membrane protein DedA with SNARE-associated domain